MSSSPIQNFFVTHFMPEKCYAQLFVNFNLHAQLLQLLRILWRRNAEGLCPASVLLQLYASSGPVLLAVARNFPLFAWGERLFLSIQTTTIVFLILHYRGDTVRGILFVLAYGGLIVLLGSHAPAQVISAMQSSSLAAIIASKALQAGSNFKKGHTGQLSSTSVLLSSAASLGLTFVSLQDTGKSLATASYLVSACFSCILLAQVLCYGSNKTSPKKED
ncbi:mannose-P-dolichol utilization defect 1 protein-like isoform X2 [Phyllopteryx taeniolatus]|uniref:mannose-P-dolichol utilization defect 1 protein-like isoform X2 n=1 Tax=Phyllopteryx taeniolatus TaxID=161469 RepID=UPI002AD26D2B|nr:mannose-P-dolichol utilization defect 1 protein-like isoform X2 [Phyllopteryx taeniolatus]